MDLAEYVKAGETDSNLWWRLASGTQLNLLDEAIDEIERLRALVRDLVSQPEPRLSAAGFPRALDRRVWQMRWVRRDAVEAARAAGGRDECK